MTLQQTNTAARTAREYLRVSKGKGKTARSITDQHADNLASEAEHGPWNWGEAYTDTGSASKYARKAREDFERLLTDLRSGAFGEPGTVLVLWEISRLARETGRGVSLIDACEQRGYMIHVTSEGETGRTYDPRNYADRHSLVTGIADAEKEARRLSARTLRGLNSAAREGRPQGQVPFGYVREYEVVDGRPRPVAQVPDSETGPLVKELYERVVGVGGSLPEPMYAIAKDWEARGVVGKNGKAFTPQSLRSMLLRPCNAGLREHNGVLTPEAWEGWTPIVSRELFDQAQRLLADPDRRKYTGEAIKHVLTMTMKCDVCGGGMVVVTRRKKNAADAVGYQCGPKGHVWVPKEETDWLLIGDLDATDPETGEPAPELGVILAYLSAPHRLTTLRQQPSSDADTQAVTAELNHLRAELKELEDAPSPKTARARIQRTADMEEIENEIKLLEVRLSTMVTPDPLAEFLPERDEADLISWWRTADVRRQRAVAALLLAPDVLGQVRVMPSPNKRNAAPVPDRIKWVRATT